MPRSIDSVKPTGARFVDGDERLDLIDRPLRIVQVTHEPQARYGPRWVVTVAVLDTGEMVGIGLATNSTRDTFMAALREGLDADGADAWAPVVLYKDTSRGRNPYWTFRTATAEEIAQAEADLANYVAPEPDPLPEATPAPETPTTLPGESVAKAGKKG